MMITQYFHRSCLPFAIVAFLCGSIAAQPRTGTPEGEAGFAPISTEVHSLPLPDSSQSTAVLLFRIPRAFFAFVRSTDPATREPYEARGEITVELLSPEDSIVGRDYRPVHILQATGSPGPETESIEGFFSFDVPIGTYRFLFEVRDLQSDRQFSNRAITVPRLSKQIPGVGVSSPLAVRTSTSLLSKGKIVPANAGGAIPFGFSGSLIVCASGVDPSSTLTFHWTLLGKPFDELSRPPDLSGDTFSSSQGLIKFLTVDNRPVVSFDTTSLTGRIISIPVSFEQLEPGTYDLSAVLHIGMDSVEFKRTFPVVWNNRPVILSRVEIAFDALQHIATEEEMNTLRELGSKAALSYFRDFWKQHSPDTMRAYNPTMVEYYRRVDESIRRFSLGTETNGYKSDRGRIFILFGAPSANSRSLKPGASPSETWTYIRAKKRFVFEDRERNGTFVLTSMDDW